MRPSSALKISRNGVDPIVLGSRPKFCAVIARAMPRIRTSSNRPPCWTSSLDKIVTFSTSDAAVHDAHHAAHSNCQDHDHGHQHHERGGNGHSHSHEHDHSSHGHSHYPESAVSHLLTKLGVIQFCTRLTHSGKWTLVSMACFAVALLSSTQLAAQLMGCAFATAMHTTALAGTFLLSGLPQTVEAVCVAGAGKIDTHVLMSLAVVGTLLLGMAQEGALLMLLFQISHSLEERFTSRARGSVERLFATVPSQATLVQLDPSGVPLMEEAAPALARSLQPGQHVLVKPGEQVPLDGVVVWGAAGLSMQHISGESRPVRVEAGAAVPAGSLNADGLLVLRITATSDESTPARIARMTAAAQTAKPKLTRMLDHVGEVWSKAVIFVALATLVGLPLLANVPLLGPGGAFYRALGVLTAGSPCAVVLVPLAYVCAIATITSRGILIKSAASLELLSSCGTVALDKTGTITTGSLTLTGARTVYESCPSGWGSVGDDSSGFASKGGQVSDSGWSSSGDSEASPGPSPVTDEEAGREKGFPVGMNASPKGHLDADPTFSPSHRPSASGTQLAEGRYSSSSPLTPAGSSCSESSSLMDSAMQFCIALSRGSNHPVSRAMVQSVTGSDARTAAPVQVSMFEQVPGLGVQGICQIPTSDTQLPQTPMMIKFGSLEFIRATLEPGSEAAEKLEQAALEHQKLSTSKAMSFLTLTPQESDMDQPASCSSLPVEGSCEMQAVAPVRKARVCLVALLSFEDVIQPGIRQAVASLQEGSWQRGRRGNGGAAEGKEVVMLTGDSEEVARQVANLVGISTYKSGLKPEEKLAYVTSFDAAAANAGKRGRGLLMMGDGINDAPALAAASVGVAVASTPNDMVAAAADIIVLNGEGVNNLPWLFAVADKTQNVIRQSLALALASVVFATLPTVAGFFPLWLAVLLHEGSTVLVALNSLRLLADDGPPPTADGRVDGSAASTNFFTNLREVFAPQDLGHSAHMHSHEHVEHAGHQHDNHHDHHAAEADAVVSSKGAQLQDSDSAHGFDGVGKDKLKLV